MGANGATKCHRVTENLERILAIELLNAAQAIEFRKPKKTSAKLEKLLTDYRKVVTFTENDEYLKPKIDASIEFLQNYDIDFIMKEII
jgi:histidine ammonia-lyase